MSCRKKAPRLRADELMQTIMRLRDVECAGHLYRSKLMMQQLFEWLEIADRLDKECQPTDSQYIVRAATFHDIGKVAIPDSILFKPAPLTDSERQVIRTHTWLGAQIAQQMAVGEEPRYIRHLTDICTYHHENWDGTGYPTGLSGESIPYSARLMHIVDVYDALVSQRPYKQAFCHAAAIELMTSERGTFFDPVILDVFIDAIEKSRGD